MSLQTEVTLVAAALPAPSPSSSSPSSVASSPSYLTMQPVDNQTQAILSPTHPTSPSSQSFLITEISMSPHNDVQTSLPEYATHDRRTVANQQQTTCQLSQCRPVLTITSALSDDGARMKECCNQGCCLHCLITVTTFRWVLLFFAVVGICCIISGVVLGAMHMSVGSSFITLSIMFIGLGVLLVIVIGIGWRCTPPGHEPCHLLLNLTDHWMLRGSSVRGRGCAHGRSGSRRRGDQNQWFGGMLYPEFEFRVPPPSYNESALDYQQTILRRVTNTQQIQSVNQLPDTPPPIYQSETGTLYRPAHSILHRFVVTLPEPPVYRAHDVRRHRAHHVTRDGVSSSNNVTENPVRDIACRENTESVTRETHSVREVTTDGDLTNVRHGMIEEVDHNTIRDVSYVTSLSQHALETDAPHVMLELGTDREDKFSLELSEVRSDYNISSTDAVESIPLDIDSAWLDKTISRDTTLNSLTESSTYALYDVNCPSQAYNQADTDCRFDRNQPESKCLDVTVDVHSSTTVQCEYSSVKSIDRKPCDKSSGSERLECSDNNVASIGSCIVSDVDSGSSVTECT